MWQPTPDSQRTQGVEIGDVGLLCTDGSFDVLFNIFAELNSLINDQGIPDYFRQLDKDSEVHHLPDDSAVFRRYLDVSTNNQGQQCYLCTTFRTRKNDSNDGATLFLPHGAYSWDAKNTDDFYEHALQNTVNWYSYTRDTHLDDALSCLIFLEE